MPGPPVGRDLQPPDSGVARRGTTGRRVRDAIDDSRRAALVRPPPAGGAGILPSVDNASTRAATLPLRAFAPLASALARSTWSRDPMLGCRLGTPEPPSSR